MTDGSNMGMGGSIIWGPYQFHQLDLNASRVGFQEEIRRNLGEKVKSIWGFPYMGVPQNGWFIGLRETPN